MDFEWDNTKSDANVLKHKVSFEDVISIFNEFILETEDPRHYDGETRFWVIGTTQDLVLFVVYTWRGQNRRIISARQASRKEKETYHAQRKQSFKDRLASPSRDE